MKVWNIALLFVATQSHLDSGVGLTLVSAGTPYIRTDKNTDKDSGVGGEIVGSLLGRLKGKSKLLGQGNGKIGNSCGSNDDCASGICSGSWSWSGWSGICVECDSDDDCEGHGESLPGILPKSFCYESVCSSWKRGHPINELGYPLRFGNGDEEPNWVKRRVHEGEPTSSLVWHFDLNKQLGGNETAMMFEANSTHINVPINTGLLAGYSMHNHAIGEHETGILETIFMPNKFSVVTPYPEACNAEKYHTLTYEGPMDDSHKMRVIAELQARDKETKQQARDNAINRNFLLAASTSITYIAAALMESIQDVINLDQARHFARHNAGDDIARRSSEIDEAKEALELAKTLPSLKSNNQCAHFEQRDGLRTTSTHIEFPLNTPIVFEKGTLEFMPSYYIGLNAGVAVVDYDEDSKVLEFHFKASQFGRAYQHDPSSPKNGLWVSSIDADHTVGPIDGRSDEFYSTDAYSYALNELIESFASIPMDYSFFDRSLTGTCEQEIADEMSSLWPRVSQEIDPNHNVFASVGNMADIARLSAKGATCGSSYLKTDAHVDLVGNGLMEWIGWTHLILEQEAHHREQTCTSTWWNVWGQFYKEQKCGDGHVQSPEECDDGNREDGDGCSSQCIVEKSCDIQLFNLQYPSEERGAKNDIFYLEDMSEYNKDPLSFLQHRTRDCGGGKQNFASLGKLIVGEYEDIVKIMSMPQERGYFLGRARINKARVPPHFLLALSDHGTDGEANDSIHQILHNFIWFDTIEKAQARVDSDESTKAALKSYIERLISEVSKLGTEDHAAVKSVSEQFTCRYMMKAIFDLDISDTYVTILQSLWQDPSAAIGGMIDPSPVSDLQWAGIQLALDELSLLIANSPALADYEPSGESFDLSRNELADELFYVTGIAALGGGSQLVTNLFTKIPIDYDIDVAIHNDVAAAVLEAGRITSPVNNVNVILQEPMNITIGSEEKTFPKGTVAALSIGLGSMDPSVFPDPLTFDHKRNNLMSHVLNYNSIGFHPDKVGTRVCVGRNIALKMGMEVLTEWLLK